MTNSLQYEYLLWIALCLGFFMFIVPGDHTMMERFVAGFVFYLFLREVFRDHFKEEEAAEDRLNQLSLRIGDRSRELAFREKRDRAKNIDIRSYL